MVATVVLTPEAAEQLRELPAAIVARMERLLARLRQWPDVSGVKRLTGDLAGKCRLRTGDYRLQFRGEARKRTVKESKVVRGKEVVTEKEIVETKIIVEKVGHRDGFYGE